MNRSTSGLPSITNSRNSLKLTSIESVMPSSHLILCCPLFLLPPILPSIRVFSNESSLHMRWPKYWSFSFSIIPSKEIPGLISFRMDWSKGLSRIFPTPQFKSINSSGLSFLHSPTFTSIYDHWKIVIIPWIKSRASCLKTQEHFCIIHQGTLSHPPRLMHHFSCGNLVSVHTCDE